MLLNLLTQNLNGYNQNSEITRSVDEIVQALTLASPAVIAVQEFGNSLNLDFTADELVRKMQDHNYLFVPTSRTVSNPVNAGLFYFAPVLRFVRTAPPFFDEFINRQAGAVFRTLEGKEVTIYSLHFPLYQRWPLDKKRMWENLIAMAKNSVFDGSPSPIALLGDFNESSDAHPTMLADKLNELGSCLKRVDDDTPSWHDRKLDHLFVGGMNIFSQKTNLNERISDHAMIMAQVEL